MANVLVYEHAMHVHMHASTKILSMPGKFCTALTSIQDFALFWGHDTSCLWLQIPQEIEDDPQEYEGEVDDAPSEDFDDEEDEEGGIAFPEGISAWLTVQIDCCLTLFSHVRKRERDCNRDPYCPSVVVTP